MNAWRTPSLLVGLLFCLLAVSTSAESTSLIQTDPLTKQQYIKLKAEHLDVFEVDGERFTISVTAEERARLEALGIGYTVVHEDLSAFYRQRAEAVLGAKAAETMGGFRTLSEIEAYLDTLAADYPTICSDKFSIGLSLQGRDQWVVKISDNVDVDEAEPEVFYNSLIHAREPAGAASVLAFMDYLLQGYGSDPAITDVVDNRELYFLVVTNPDGYYYNELTDPGGGGNWRKNRRDNGDGTFGVDLNRNYGTFWGYDDNGSSPNTNDATYRGTEPFSEPETQNLRDFVISRDFVIVNNVHTYSNLVLWPWGYETGQYTHREAFYKILGDSLTQYNNYTPTVAWGLYPANGAADDWFWGDTLSKPRVITFTTEIGTSTDGFWPSPARIPDLTQENIFPNFFLAQIADAPYTLSPPDRPSLVVADSVGSSFEVAWATNDTINPPVSYRLVQFEDKLVVTDDAEADNGYWAANAMVLSTNRANSGSSSWHTINENSTLHTLASLVRYQVGIDDSLRFAIWYDIETDWDYFYVQVSVDGGETWANLANDLTTNTDPNGSNLGNGITGSSGAWVETAFDLQPYSGQEIDIRLQYVTDQFVLEEGVYLDDIQNVATFAVEAELGAAITDTTFAVSGLTGGDYWYQVQGTDAEGQLSEPSELARTTVFQEFVVGDCTGDGTLNLTDLTCAVSYLFQNGTAPDPLARIDVNCDSQQNLTDLTLLVNHLFVTFAPLPCAR